jgi:hypothetical protein
MGATGILWAVLGWYGAQQPEPAEIIMAKLAANQERAQEMRSAFVYHQSMLIRFKRGNGKLAREEEREYVVTPTDRGFKKDLTHFVGKYERGGKLIEYDKPGYQYKGTDIDGSFADSLAESLTNDKETRDGMSKDPLPLTLRMQEKFNFQLEGKENYRGTDVYRVTFKPKRLSLLDCDDDDASCWAGEVLVDAHEYQPVLVTSWLAKSLPKAVQILLGTNLKHLGFKVAYKKFDEGLWFPVTYGSEFEVRGLFFYKRTIALAATNSGFRRADVSSTVRFALPMLP